MTWLALADHDDRRLSLRGLGADRRDAPVLADDPATPLARGSILFETRLPPDGQPQVLFGHRATDPTRRSLTFQAVPGGGVALVQVQGAAIAHGAVTQAPTGRADEMRVTYSWDLPTRWGRLTLERPEDTQVISVPVADPIAPTLGQLRALFLGDTGRTFAPEMIFAALSDQVEAVGPMPTLLPATPLATPTGYRPVSALRRGDTVLTRRAGTVPVLHRLARMVPARGSFAPVRLRAPYFGLQQDVIVAPDQRLLIDGPEVEYLFGQEAVLVPARHLVNGFAALAEPCGPVILYTQLLLPGHETLLAAGTALESLHIGRIRRDPARLGASVLHHLDRSRLPEHGRPAHPVLRWYDAIHLARQRAA